MENTLSNCMLKILWRKSVESDEKWIIIWIHKLTETSNMDVCRWWCGAKSYSALSFLLTVHPMVLLQLWFETQTCILHGVIGKLMCKRITVKHSENEKRLNWVLQICFYSWIHIVNFFLIELQLLDFPVLKTSDNSVWSMSMF